MPYINVEVDMSDFDLEDLIDEIERRHSRERDREEIQDWINAFDESEINSKDLSVVDKIKLDFLIENLQKINISDLENLIK
jgi:hypothetical protein